MISKISKYNIDLRLVEIEDAELLISFRTDERRKRFISATDRDVSKQIEWLRGYKSREAEGIEYYFIATDSNGEKFCTYRVYNFDDNIVEIGSWVTKPNYSNSLNSVKVDLLMKEFVFETLNFDKLCFEVRRDNKSVVRYHKLFGPRIIRETDQDIFFELSKNTFYSNRLTKFKNIV